MRLGSHDAESTGHPVLIAAEPQLFVSDIAASCAFFARTLGFRIAFLHGDPPFYGQVARDGARLNLRHVDQPLADRALLARQCYLAATIIVAGGSEIERLFAEFQGAGVDFPQELKPQPWGTRDFSVKDPDGNLLCFAAPAE